MEITAVLLTEALHTSHTMFPAGEAHATFLKASMEIQMDALKPLPFRGETEIHCHHFTLLQREDNLSQPEISQAPSLYLLVMDI